VRRTLAVAVVLLLACSKKKEAEPAAPPPAPSPVVAVSASSSAPVAEAPPPVVDDSVESDLTLHEDLVLPDGKQLPIGKITPAGKDAITAHAAVIQTKYEELVKAGFKQTKRFNASWIPATYIILEKPAKNDNPAITKMVEFEGVSTNELTLANDSTPYDLWNTPRGYFIDVTGDDRLTYILRATDATHTECLGKAWDPSTGKVETIEKLPEFVTRGRDVNGDGKNEFPTAIFAYELAGFARAIIPAADTLCDVKHDGRLTIDVVGVDRDGEFRAYYEKRLRAAKARVDKLRKWADDAKAPKHKKGNLRFSRECALDVAQAAAEVYAYDVSLGSDAGQAQLNADNAMKGLALKAEACEGLSKNDGDASKDQWPDMRGALLAWKPPHVFAVPATP